MKWEKDIDRYFTIDETQMANKHTKPCSTSLTIRKTHIKTTVRCHYTPTRMA